ncbi:MAG: gluconokinase [Acidimicrobiales bacterium]
MTDRAAAVVVMGVSGSGKSTVGAALAEALGGRFVDGDDLHPAANVAKMSAGVALDDDDRWPWLDRVADTLADSSTDGPVVVACSALRRRYRDRLRRVPGVVFVHLHLDVDDATTRLRTRGEHFMDERLIQSQFATLETPTADETDVIVVDATLPFDEVVAAAADSFAVDLGQGRQT